jgi:hypothetical protein
MPAYQGICTVNQAGPSMDGTETPGVLPVIYVNLTDTTSSPPAFSNEWFYAMVGSQNQVLAVALAAINASKLAYAIVNTTPATTGQCPQLQALYLQTT